MEIVQSFVIAFLILVAPVGFAGTKHYWVTIVAYLFYAFVAMSGMFAMVFGFCLVSILLLLALRQYSVRPKWVIGILCLWTLSAPTAGLLSGAKEYRELQARYPIASLSERLAYEQPHVESETTANLAEPKHDVETKEPRNWHREIDDPTQAHRRRVALEQFHSLTFSQFVSAFGFGANRMTAIQRHFIDYEPPDAASKPLPSRPQEVDLQTTSEKPFVSQIKEPGPIGGPRLHQQEVVQQFTSSLMWAYISSHQKAAGFKPHGFLKVPTIHGNGWDQWQISRLDLVSLLKFAEPRVYLSERLPRMEDLQNAETRPVDDFERQALEQLRGGEDIVVDQQLNTIRMVGAVRATKQCLDCHSVRRGDLLGAFSYLLDRKQPLPPPKVDGRPVSLRMPGQGRR